MRYLFLNQYFPPDPAPTGVLLKEVAETMQQQGHEVVFVSAAEGYRSGQGRGGRMKREAMALWSILRQALGSPRADVVVSGSSPPCLLIVAALVALLHRARHLHWAMDLYPEIAVALREIPLGWPARILQALMGWCYRRAAAVVALDDDMAAHLAQLYRIKAEIIRPWVTAEMLAPRARALESQNSAAPVEKWTWLYSGNLGRAHEWETLLDAQSIVEREGNPIWLVFQGSGPAWPAAQARAQELGLRQVEWRPYAPEADLPATLLAAQAAVVTQRPEAQSLLWPSKLALLLSLPVHILWVGPKDGAIARMLQERGGSAIFALGDAAGLAAHLQRQYETSAPATPQVIDANLHREESLTHWKRLLSTSAPTRSSAT